MSSLPLSREAGYVASLVSLDSRGGQRGYNRIHIGRHGEESRCFAGVFTLGCDPCIIDTSDEAFPIRVPALVSMIWKRLCGALYVLGFWVGTYVPTNFRQTNLANLDWMQRRLIGCLASNVWTSSLSTSPVSPADNSTRTSLVRGAQPIVSLPDSVLERVRISRRRSIG